MKQWRINLIFIFFIIFWAAIIGRLLFIQVLNHQYWQALAQGQQIVFESMVGDRGEIFLKDRKGVVPLAINRVDSLCFASPQEIEREEELAENLADILDLDKDVLLEKFQAKESLFVPIKHKLAEEEINKLKELNWPGIYLKEEKNRYYPQESLASQVVGFLSGDGEGHYGIEGYWQETITGKESVVKGEKGPEGYLFLFNRQSYKPQKGSDLVLTIDYNIQYFAEMLLEKAKEELNIKGGQIVVADPNSGGIIALANLPGFNPNQYSSQADLGVFQNGAVQKIFEPGSVFKPITIAAALDKGKITPQTIYIDEGKVAIGTYTIYNYDGRVWGEKTMTEVLDLSINTGAIFVERQLGHDNFLKYIEDFGFFEPTGIDLQGEIFSENKEFKKGYEVNFATASFGQGIEITPIQLTRAFCAIANGGELVNLHVVEKVIDPLPSFSLFEGDNGQIDDLRSDRERILSSKTTSQLTAMLVSGVEDGYSKSAKVLGYFIAGKTGTAQVPWSSLGIQKRGYSEQTWQSFVGFAPAFNPQFVILVKLDDPEAKSAGYSAAPIFRDLAKYIIDYWQIPPDYE
ncbi:peptidoglycan D,D-transpeptidase FtsI family protein [Patescibacteria group bacterium]